MSDHPPTRHALTAPDGTQLSYLTAGHGPAALLLHGFASSAAAWWKIGAAPNLAPIRRVLAPDARGHGHSGAPETPKAYGARLISDLVALLDHDGQDAADVVGFSMGAELGLALAARHPGRVRSLTLAGSGWSPPEIMGEYQKWYDRLVAPKPGRSPPPNAAALAALIKGMPQVIGLPETAIAALSMPVYGIIGEFDDERPYLERISTALPRFQPVILPGLDHLGTWRSPDFPKLVAQAVLGRL